MSDSESKPLVSVIIPVYNMEQYLPETLQSVLASTYKNIEIIVVDDGSSDNSLKVIKSFSEEFPNIKLFTQKNAGASSARNHAVSKSSGKYILPVDADNHISIDYIEKAVEVIEKNPDIKLVYCKAEFFGDKSGNWILPDFNIRLLSRKNMIDNCSLYRKADWEKTGGYCEEIIGREDWDFWISLLKSGGKVYRLPIVGLYYRVRKNSYRKKGSKLKRELIAILNKRHKAFFAKQLGGKLRYNRTCSRIINFFASFFVREKVIVNPEYIQHEEFVYSVPDIFAEQGELLHKARNEVKLFDMAGIPVVVKKFGKPNFLNKFIYGNFRHSKARRSFLFAGKLQVLGISTPEPVAYIEKRIIFLFDVSYYICRNSECKNNFRDIERNPDFPDRKNILEAVGRFTAKMHQQGIIHSDYSAGNILLGKTADNELKIEVIDLNRIKFRKVDMITGCKNFERLNADEAALVIMAKSYALERGFNTDKCIEYVKLYRWKKHRN